MIGRILTDKNGCQFLVGKMTTGSSGYTTYYYELSFIKQNSAETCDLPPKYESPK